MSSVNSINLVASGSRAILREADEAIRNLPANSHHLLYSIVHHHASRIARVDSFYVGYYMDGVMMLYPYSFDDGTYDDPEKFPYSPDGLAANMLVNCRPYRYSHDGGYLLNKGRNFGDKEKISQDCIIVPIKEYPERIEAETGSIALLGVMGVLSYEASVYGDQEEHSFQWLADTLGIVQSREREDTLRLKSLGVSSIDGQAPEHRMESAITEVLEKMATIRRLANDVKEAADSGNINLTDLIETLCQQCEQHQTETIELLMEIDSSGRNPLTTLSPAQRLVAEKLAHSYFENQTYLTVEELADQLGLSQNTIRAHRKQINKKLGIADRVGVRRLAALFFGNETRPESSPG